METGPAYRTPDRARVAGHGVSVTALITRLRLEDGDANEVARAYRLPDEAIAGAIAYYERHRAVIDAAITLNEAAFAA